MFYINYQSDKVVGVVDTADFVEEFYSPAEVEGIIQKGIIILPQEFQSGLLSFILNYVTLVDFLESSGVSNVYEVLDYAEGAKSNKEKVDTRIMTTRYFGNYERVVAETRKRFKCKAFGYRSVNSSVYMAFKELLVAAYNWETSKLSRLEVKFCKDYCFQRDLVHHGFQLLMIGV